MDVNRSGSISISASVVCICGDTINVAIVNRAKMSLLYSVYPWNQVLVTR